MHESVIKTVTPLLPVASAQQHLSDLAAELLAQSNALSAKLHRQVKNSIAQLMTAMNCYYSNLIEGHDTHPRDIGRALINEFSFDHKQRALQHEAKAYIEVQQAIDNEQMPFAIMSPQFICWVHQQFCQRLPEEFLWVTNRDNQQRVPVVPGELRTGWVQVGKHMPPAAAGLLDLLQHFADGYQLQRQSTIQKIIIAAASHHRLLWIHPFFDGNGRVARLFSYAVLANIGLSAQLWSIARGFARHNDAYKMHLGGADMVEQHHENGSIALSEQGLVQFCEFFLSTAIEQVVDMQHLFDPKKLSQRIEYYVECEQLPEGSWPLLREALFMGEFPPDKAAMLTGHNNEQAGIVLNQLIQRKLLVSDSANSSVHLGFPTEILDVWLPKLYPCYLNI